MASLDAPALGTVLVIGGCGFLGTHIVEQVLHYHPLSKIIVLDTNTLTNRHPGGDVRYITGSITSRSTLTVLLQTHSPQVIFHTVSPFPLSEDKALFDKVNIEGTRTLLECVEEAGCVKALVYTSSSSLVHNSLTPLDRATEDMRIFYHPEQKAYYSHTKAVAEDLVLAANRQHGMLTTSIRPAGLFGERDKLLGTNQVRLGSRKICLGHGKNLFDFTYCGNNAYAQVLAAEALLQTSSATRPIDKDKKVDGEAFIITNDEPWPAGQFTHEITNAVGYNVPRSEMRCVPAGLLLFLVEVVDTFIWLVTAGRKRSPVTVRRVSPLLIERTFDISKAKERLGYRPLVDMREGIKRSAAWYRENMAIEMKKET